MGAGASSRNQTENLDSLSADRTDAKLTEDSTVKWIEKHSFLESVQLFVRNGSLPTIENLSALRGENMANESDAAREREYQGLVELRMMLSDELCFSHLLFFVPATHLWLLRGWKELDDIANCCEDKDIDVEAGMVAAVAALKEYFRSEGVAATFRKRVEVDSHNSFALCSDEAPLGWVREVRQLENKYLI